tara:strand:+ start:1620 stop:2393 length:774 start_codon:yes stop_codon:yes gene_type:complete
MKKTRKGALERAVKFFDTVSKKSLTRAELKTIAKENRVRNGLEMFALTRGWCTEIKMTKDPHKVGRTPSRFEFKDLHFVSPLHIRLLLDDANAYIMECKEKRENRREFEALQTLFPPASEEKTPVATAEFVWTSESTKMFAMVYASNFKSLPSRFNYKTYHGLSMDEKVNQFMHDFVRPETQQVTISVDEIYTRTQSRTFAIPGDVNVEDYLEMNPHLSDFDAMPTLEGTPFTDTSELKLTSKEFRHKKENSVGGTL